MSDKVLAPNSPQIIYWFQPTPFCSANTAQVTARPQKAVPEAQDQWRQAHRPANHGEHPQGQVPQLPGRVRAGGGAQAQEQQGFPGIQAPEAGPIPVVPIPGGLPARSPEARPLAVCPLPQPWLAVTLITLENWRTVQV